MARRRRHSTTPPPRSSDTLEPPFPAPPTRPTLFALYCTYPHSSPPTDPNKRIIVLTFAAYYSARAFVDLFLTQPSHITHKWLNHDTILTDQDVSISTRFASPSLEDLMEYTPTHREDLYLLPDNIARQRLLLTRPLDHSVVLTPDGEITTASLTSPHSRSSHSSPREKIDRTGLTHVSVIASSLNITPREARQALRKSKTPKPRGGWSFTPDQVPVITDIIKQHLKT